MNLTQEGLAEMAGLTRGQINIWEHRRQLPPKREDYDRLNKILKFDTNALINDTNDTSKVNEANIIGAPKAIYSTRKKDFVELSDGKYIMTTPLVSQKAQAGYLTGWGDEEYIAELPQFPIIVDKPHRGEYVSFEVSGESMNDGSSMSISPGDIVTGRKIDRSHWKNKLHLKKYSEYVIVSIKGGIIVKEIIEHDTDNCTIICRSRNPDKKKYPDQTVHLNEVIQIFNIVQVTKKR